jgi:hypothetical protein
MKYVEMAVVVNCGEIFINLLIQYKHISRFADAFKCLFLFVMTFQVLIIVMESIIINKFAIDNNVVNVYANFVC